MTIFEAAQHGNLHQLRWMLGEEVSPNAISETEFSPLMLAAKEGHLEAVNLLLEAGADLETHGLYGARALFLAASKGHMSVVKRLVEKGASISARAENGAIAEIEAYSHGHQEVGDFLKQAADDQRQRPQP